MSSSNEYKVGALSALIGGNEVNSELNSLFTTSKKQKESSNVVTSTVSESKTTVETLEKKSDSSLYEIDVSKDQKIETKTTKKTKKKKKKNVIEDEVQTTVVEPSRKTKVKLEEEKQRVIDLDSDKRTVFVGNLSITTTKKELLKLFKPYGSIESVRFRGAARPDLKTTKKIAVITKTTNENRSTYLAYVKFKEENDAIKSCQLNGTTFKNNSIRVDISSNKSKDQNKAVFIGNLDFMTEEEEVRNHFKDCGDIADIRLIRDSMTGMGKGFGYVNFTSSDSVITALQLNGSELKNRQIRVSRSTNRPKPVIRNTIKGKPTEFKRVTKTVTKNSFRGLCLDDRKRDKKRPSKADMAKKKIANKLLRK